MILVFGKTGQVARELQKLQGIKCLNRRQANLTDPTECRDVIVRYKPTAVINAAAYTAVDKAEDEEDLANVINGEAPGAMAKACAELNIPLVHISTDYVFFGKEKKSWQTSDTAYPQNAYGRSKLKGENLVSASGANYAILRTSWVISSHGSNFVKTMLSLSETRDRLNVVDDQIGGPTPACDIAKTCVEIANQLINDPEKSGVYHFSGMPDVSWCEFANTIFEQAGKNVVAQPVSTSEYPTSALRPLNSRLDCSLTKTAFDIPRPYWRVGLEDIFTELGLIDETS